MSTSHPHEPPDPPSAVMAALARVLRPLVRLLLAHGVTYPALSRYLKHVYVEVAERHFALDERTMSDSRVSLLTGVHRKDVRTLRARPLGTPEAPQSVTLGSQLIARWIADKEYMDAKGRPRVLPRRATKGPSFDALAATVARQDVKPRVVLDELLRLGLVELTDSDSVRLRVEAFVPETGLEEKVFYLGRNVADHLAASVHNLESDDPPFMERAVSYHTLRAADVEKLREQCERLGSDALKRINRRALSLRRRSEGEHDADRRMIFGVYFYSERQRDDAPEDET